MMDAKYIFCAILICALCTFAIRALPFILFSGQKELPGIINYIGDVLPPAIMVILVVYCIKHVNFLHAANWMPEAISILMVAILHAWKRNILLSIASGTILYMILIQFVFV